MKKKRKILAMMFFIVLSSCSQINSSTSIISTINEREAVLLDIEGATIDEDKKEAYIFVDQNTTSVFLSNKVKCSPNSTWKLYYDKLRQTEIPTKIAASRDGNLKSGDNVFYIVVTSFDGTIVNVYTLTIYKSYLIDLTYLFNNNVLKTENALTGYEKEIDYIPSIEGYAFNYWMDYNNERIDSIIPYDNMTLYANATANQYIITLNPNGGSASNNTIVVTYDDDYVLPIPTKIGYTFAGWFDGNTQLTNNEGKSLAKWKISSNKTLSAKWTINQYVLSLKNSNSEAGIIAGSGTYNYESNVTIRAIANGGYKFVGWYNFNGVCVSTDNAYTFKMRANETLTAKWEYVELTLNYVVNGKIVHTEIYTLETHIDNLYEYESIDEFYGWYITSNFDSSTTKVTNTQGLVISNNSTYLYGGTSNQKGFGFKYEYNQYTIVGYKGNETNLEIPSIINGISVKTIRAYAFENNVCISSIEIPNSVTSIGSYAFSGCFSLTIYCEASSRPSGWDSSWYGGRPVYWGVKANDIIYQDGLQYLIINGEAVVTGHNANITNVVIPETIEVNGVTYAVTSIGDNAFSGCSSLTSIVIPSSVTSIGGSAFYNCSSLTSIEIPNSVTSIGGSAFYNCSSLTSIEIPNSVTSIGSYAFSGCFSLTIYCEASSRPSGWDGYWNNIHWSDNRPVYWGVTHEDIIYQDGLQYLIINGEAVVIGHNANITNVVIPETIEVNGVIYAVTSIGDSAFYNCSSLTSIVIPSSVTSIRTHAFYNCSFLTIYCEASRKLVEWGSNVSVYWGVRQEDIIYQDGLQYLIINGEAVVTRCDTNVTSVIIPETIEVNGVTYAVTSIGDNAFSGCSSLTSIVIPSSVTSIGGSAFEGCNSLTIYCEANSRPSGWDSHWNYPNRPVYWGYQS